MIYILTNSPFPYGMAPVKRKLCLAKALIQEGANCKVLCFCRTQTKGDKSLNTQSKGVFQGVPYEYIGGKTERYSNPYIAKVETGFLILLLYLRLLLSLKKGDVIYVYTHDKFARQMNLAVDIAHFKGAKAVRELCEIPGKGNTNIEGEKEKQFVLEKCFPNYDGFVAISDSLAALAKQYMKPSAKILKVPIIVDYKDYYLEDKSSEVNVQYIFHSGSLFEQKDGILGMIEAFGKASWQLNKPICFISTGRKENSPHSKDIDTLIAKYNLHDKLIFTGFVTDDKLRDYLQKASIVIINKTPNLQNTFCFSTKLGEYMAAGKAIIITNVGEAMNWLTDDKDAFIIPPCDNDKLVEAIVALFNEDETRKRLGENARITCKKSFDYKVWGEQLKKYFEQL